MGNDHPWTLNAKANLGINYRDAGRLEEAIALLEEAHRKGAKDESVIQGGKDDGTSAYREDLLLAYIRAGRKAEGMQLIREDLKTARATVPANSAQLASRLAVNGFYLLQLQAWTDAEQILRECLVIRETLAPDEWTTFNTKSMLGDSLLGQKKYDGAEPLLLAGYEGMAHREARIPQVAKACLIEALERLVQLYEATGKLEEAAKWRKRLEALPEAKKKQ